MWNQWISSNDVIAMVVIYRGYDSYAPTCSYHNFYDWEGESDNNKETDELNLLASYEFFV